MTTEEFEKIAAWMGWERKELPPTCTSRYTYKTNNGWVHDKTSLTDSEAVEALERLYSEGKGATLRKSKYGYRECVIQDAPQGVTICKGQGPTTHEAVEQALLQIAAKEG